MVTLILKDPALNCQELHITIRYYANLSQCDSSFAKRLLLINGAFKNYIGRKPLRLSAIYYFTWEEGIYMEVLKAQE